MTDDSTLVDIPESYEDFKAVFEGREVPEAEGEDTEDNALATDEDEDAAEEADEAPADEESEDEDEGEDESEDEPEPEPEPKDKGQKRKSGYQERINELTRARHEAERREQMLLARLEAIEARQPKDPVQQTQEASPQGAPTPDDVDEKGEPKYALGEYDPMFIRDFTKFTIAQETAAIREQEAQQQAAAQLAAAQNALKAQWNEKLVAAEQENPEIREHIADLVDTFQGIHPAYGEYLATTIMQSENGPAVMEYLSQNIGEAQNIVASGPAAATLAIGRIEAKLALASARPSGEEKRNKKIPSAPTPPSAVTKGNRGRSSVSPDTDDLAAFKRDFGF